MKDRGETCSFSGRERLQGSLERDHSDVTIARSEKEREKVRVQEERRTISLCEKSEMIGLRWTGT